MDAIRALFLILFMLMSGSIWSQHAIPSQIIDSASIRESGYLRLSDILQLVTQGNRSTINGDRWFLELNGGGNFDVQNFSVMVDGAKINMDLSGQIPLNYLLIPINDISRVEIVTTPGLYYGEFNSNGIIHFITCKKKSGITYKGLFTQGNETGDPGPFLYASNANIDRIGLHFAHVLNFTSTKFTLDYTFYYSDYYFRDTSILNRITSLNTPITKSNLIGHKLALFQHLANFSHKLNFSLANANDYLFHPIENEIQGEIDFLYTSYVAELKLNRNNTLFYNGTYLNQKTIPYRLQHLPIISNQSWQTNQVGLRGNLSQFDSAFSYEISGQYSLVSHPYRVQDKPSEVFNYKLGLGKRLKDDRQINAVIGVVALAGNWAPLFSLNFLNHKRKSYHWSMSLSHEQQLFSSMPTTILNAYNLGYWVEPNHKTKQTMLQGDLNFAHLGPVRLLLLSNIRLQNNMAQFNWEALHPDSGINGMLFFSNFVFWGKQLELSYNPIQLLSIKLVLHHQNILRGNNDFMKSIPTSWLNAIVSLKLPERIVFWFHLYGQTQETNNLILLSEFSLSKKALGDMLNLSFNVRNLTNSYHQYHPKGAQCELSFHISLSCNLNAQIPKR
jgi:hypothetical protein